MNILLTNYWTSENYASNAFSTKNLLILFLSFFLTSCGLTNGYLIESESFDYKQAGYVKVHIGPYSLYLPSRFEKNHNLITKINLKAQKETFNGNFYIDIPNKKFLLKAKDYYLFALIEQPEVDIFKFSDGDVILIPTPDNRDQKFYLNKKDFWQRNLKYDAYLENFWLYKDNKYVLKLSFASATHLSHKEIQRILASVKRQID
jgi:hypothetical protein